jgi:hypothetical protein
LKKVRLRLDVDIGSLSIELEQISNQTSIGIETQYQNQCLNVDETLDGIARRDKSNSRLDVFNLKLRIDPSSSRLFPLTTTPLP